MGLFGFLTNITKRESDENAHTSQQRPHKQQKVESPATSFATPADVLSDKELSHDDKKEALNIWEQDARQLLTASNEGMPGCEEGIDPHDHHGLGEVVRAKDKLGDKPALKSAH